MRTNKEIRASELRVIDPKGEQLGVMSSFKALQIAEDAGLDLIEIVPNAKPPVAKIMDYGKFRYDQTKREKENKKTQHQVKIKEVKLSPNISEHDFEFKMKQAYEFLQKGCKVKVSLFFRGREMAHQDIGKKVLEKAIEFVSEVGMVEASPKMMGRTMATVVAPISKKK